VSTRCYKEAMTPVPQPLWTPKDAGSASRMAAFARFAGATTGLDLTSYDALWTWSTDDVEAFWAALWKFFELDGVSTYDEVLRDPRMPGAQWFTGARLNVAGYCLSRGEPSAVAIVGAHETGRTPTMTSMTTMTYAELTDAVAALAGTLRRHGVRAGDVVVGYLPNIPEAVVALLATASLGAIWSAVGQDYAGPAAVDRFAQLDPVVLIAADGYRFAGKDHARLDASDVVRRGLPTLKGAIIVANLGSPTSDDTRADDPYANWLSWMDATSGPASFAPVDVPFDHPLWVLFSSGTTGTPKGLVHGHGGILVEMLKQLGLHLDLGAADRLFWHTSPSWMMWNFQALTLAVGGSLVTYDGSPTSPSPDALWRVVADTAATFFGISPAFLQASEATGLHPAATHDLSALRGLGCTGSPLSPRSHEWAARELGGLPVWSLSGGTDVCSAFVGGSPTVPIWPGELSVRCLGAAVAAYDGSGRPVVGDVGELVVTKPLPSMPVRLWNDADFSRYRSTYFEPYPGVWRHGDWVTITERGSVVIHGRSDSTLNRHGVRMGSADIYAALQSVPEVLEAMVIGAEEPGGGYWMPLFVVLASGAELDDRLRDRIRRAIREFASPRHVPDDILAVPGIPHTRTGKKLEVPIKRLLMGAPADTVADPRAIDDPRLLAAYDEIGRAHRTTSGT
jgi:acetoacetyl-CoA synthetase